MMVIKGSPAAKGILTSDMAKRNRLQEEKMTKLQSPNFHVVYNLPKSMTEKQLKKLFIDAVTSRATKQKPVNQQVAPRVPNNPETFGPEHRLIVSFVLDNVQILKLRKTKL
ncbi:hypothetical protein NC652_011609 [Populus alba x Populus x berolinensis]|nr:hypothetical protein NC652_011609 [Populus alba x Populus x berolinensis]